MSLLARWVGTTLLIVAANSAGAQSARRAVLTVDHSPANDSCVLVHTREDLVRTLRGMGLRAGQALPAIGWGKQGAAVLAPRDAATAPAAYIPISSKQPGVLVPFRRVQTARPNTVYVLEIDLPSAMADRCTAY